jgi:heterodisulfide reductase subunit C
MRQQVLHSLTPWVCASCYACTVRCPAGIAITEVMYALKRMALAAGITPAGSDAHRFATLFTDAVSRRGRAFELETMLQYMLLRHPGRLLGQATVGVSMLTKGRMPVLPHSIEGLRAFHAMVRRARELEKERA